MLMFIMKMLILVALINMMFSKIFKTENYIKLFMNKFMFLIKQIFDNFIFIVLFLFIFYQNVYGNIFYCLIPTLNYINTVHISLVYFIPILIIMLVKQYVNFVSHMMPYGAPLWLFIILPLIEFFSFIIRPLTLCIRLSTNLCAGHIIIYMLSNFALDLEIPNVSVHLIVSILTVLEFMISMLQAYIFCNLIILYYEEI